MGSCEIVAGSVTKVFGTSVSYIYLPFPIYGVRGCLQKSEQRPGNDPTVEVRSATRKEAGCVCVCGAGRRGQSHTEA